VLQRPDRRDLPQFDRSPAPRLRPDGPDLSRVDADLDESINRLYHYHDQLAPVCEALLDQHVANGIGNVYRCEVLWACECAPVRPGVGARRRRLLAPHHHGRRAPALEAAPQPACHRVDHQPGSFVRGDLAVYGRNGQRCARCGDTVEVCQPSGFQRQLYWCPGCQVHRSLETAQTMYDVYGDDEHDGREMDPHPAAAKFLSNLPWRRPPLAG
jgi:endonuclease-8